MSSNRKRGRLTKHQQLVMHQFMIKCFEEDLSAPTAARKANVDRKTAYGHYDQIVKQCMEKNSEDLRERQRKDRVQRIASLDKDIMEFTDLLKQVRDEKEKYINDKKLIPNYLIRDEIDIIKNRSEIKDRKAGYLLKPTLDEAYSERKSELSDKKNEEDDIRDGKTC